jgi:hypothetical protein
MTDNTMAGELAAELDVPGDVAAELPARENTLIDWAANPAAHLDVDDEQEQIDREIWHNIVHARKALAVALDQAVDKVELAKDRLEELVGPLYDVEYADTRDASDVTAYADLALLQLRAALRIAEAKVEQAR